MCASRRSRCVVSPEEALYANLPPVLPSAVADLPLTSLNPSLHPLLVRMCPPFTWWCAIVSVVSVSVTVTLCRFFCFKVDRQNSNFFCFYLEIDHFIYDSFSISSLYLFPAVVHSVGVPLTRSYFLFWSKNCEAVLDDKHPLLSSCFFSLCSTSCEMTGNSKFWGGTFDKRRL